MSSLRAVRVDAGMSIEQLAERSKVSPEQIRNIEAGRAKNPRAVTLTKLAGALGVRPSDIDPMLAPNAAGRAA